jgi:hypothetical protein
LPTRHFKRVFQLWPAALWILTAPLLPAVDFNGLRAFEAGYAESVAVADLNRDGNLDMAVAGAGNVAILLGNGDGGFQPAVFYAVGGRASTVLVADFNGDGKPDVAVGHYDSESFSILLGNGDGTFQPATAIPTGEAPVCLAAGDFNGDGHTDLAVCLANSVRIFLGNGDGTFQPVAN